MTTPTLTDRLRAYEAAFNEPGDDARAELLARAVTEDVVVSPGYKPDAPVCIGREAFGAEVADVIASRPPGGVRLTLYGGVDSHHGWIRFRWRVLSPDGTVFAPAGFPIEGVDVAHVATDGRLDQVIIFLGCDPPDEPV
jgi:hypothetical protein